MNFTKKKKKKENAALQKRLRVALEKIKSNTAQQLRKEDVSATLVSQLNSMSSKELDNLAELNIDPVLGFDRSNPNLDKSRKNLQANPEGQYSLLHRLSRSSKSVDSTQTISAPESPLKTNSSFHLSVQHLGDKEHQNQAPAMKLRRSNSEYMSNTQNCTSEDNSARPHPLAFKMDTNQDELKSTSHWLTSLRSDTDPKSASKSRQVRTMHSNSQNTLNSESHKSTSEESESHSLESQSILPPQSTGQIPNTAPIPGRPFLVNVVSVDLLPQSSKKDAEVLQTAQKKSSQPLSRENYASNRPVQGLRRNGHVDKNSSNKYNISDEDMHSGLSLGYCSKSLQVDTGSFDWSQNENTLTKINGK